MLVKELMKKPKVIDKDVSLKKASEIIKNEEIGSIIVVKDGEIIGIVTSDDIIDNYGSKKTDFKIMTKKVIKIDPETDVDQAIGIMKEKGVHYLPVVDDVHGLVGIISHRELLGKCEEEAEFLIK